jgi:catechol 2,3-dioxygenase-like lactoylglutathione lyase family enzyme
MLDHVSIGVRDFPRARAFYDAVFATLGAKAHHTGDDYAAFAIDPDGYRIEAHTQAP